MKKLFIFLLIVTSICACKNADIEFPNYDYSAVYFPYQYPVRTITLGEDIYDNTLDLQHKCQIQATLAGVYENKNDVTINFVVADTICTGYNFDKTTPLRPILAMPKDYYTLASNQIIINKGSISGGVEVQLTDKFFADPLAIQNNYVIPLIMTSATNADSILHGKPITPNTTPRRLFARKWDVLPKDYILYAVKYINTWHGYYLRRGIDVQTGAVNSTIVRHPNDITTYDAATTDVSKWLCYLTTSSLNVLQFPVTLKDSLNTNYVNTLNLTFDADGNCTVTSSNPTIFTATGSGKFVKKGEKNSFGNIDRDALYLDYTINHIAKRINTHTTDTLLMRNRGVVKETFGVIAQ